MSSKTKCLVQTDQFLHVYNRGVDRSTLFFRSPDFEYFVDRMSGAMKDADLLMQLYVLMPNHFHVVVKQSKPFAVSDFMWSVCGGYARYVNRLRGRSGHLFQERFKVEKLDGPAALLRISRYIHFNPVKAGLAASYVDWKFGSGRLYAGKEVTPFIDSESIFSVTKGRENYLSFLENYDPADPDSVWRYIL